MTEVDERTLVHGNADLSVVPEEPMRSSGRRALRRFTRNRGAVIGIVVLSGGGAGSSCPRRGSVQSIKAELQRSHGTIVASPLRYGPPRAGRPEQGHLWSQDFARCRDCQRRHWSFGRDTVGLGGRVFWRSPRERLMRFVDALLAFPGILLALVVIAALGPSLFNVMIAVGVSTVPQYARLARSRVLSVKRMPFVEAAQGLGGSSRRIIVRHVFPNVLASLVVLSTLQVGNAILVGSGLSFLGMGAQPPTPEWGLMTAQGRTYLDQAWWVTTFPGLAILTTVMAINLIGDGLREALDPHMKVE